jgi:type III secretion system chaperone SycN
VTALDDAVGAFGRSMSLDRLAVPATGALTLAFERRGTLCLERKGEDLVVYLRRAYPFAPVQLLSAALDSCHWRHNRLLPVRAGMRGDDLVFLIELGGRDLTQSRLEQAVSLLGQLHDQLAR